METVKNSWKAILILFGITGLGMNTAAFAQTPQLGVPYVPPNPKVADARAELAGVHANDVVCDLGCGDGRIVVTAAKKYGASGRGIDIDPERIREARENAKKAGVEDKVEFIEGDLFESDVSEASVVTLYLLSSVNMKLRPMLLKQLKPGTRIVSHAFDMGDWEPDETRTVDGARIYLWTVPAE